MKDVVFESQEELYERIRPALRSKKSLLKQSGYKNISEQDIWDYLRLNKWSLSTGLELCEMVDDILHTDNDSIIKYYHNKYMNVENDVEEKNILVDLPRLRS